MRRGDYLCEPVPLADVRPMVARWHYAGGSANTAVASHALVRVEDGARIGAALWMPPTKGAAVATYPEGDWRAVLALSRLVIEPGAPTNAASLLLGASERLVRRDDRWRCLVTYADTAEGHTGAIYRATNWQYLGLTAPTYRWIDADGRIVSRLSTRSRSWQEMRDLGYRSVGPFAKHKFRKVIR